MLRRISSLVVPCKLSSRGYFHANVGETGIWGKTMRNYNRNLNIVFVASVVFLVYVIKGPYAGGRQFAPWISDLSYSDGTELEGEEAGAHARIEYERIMPFMDELKEKFSSGEED